MRILKGIILCFVVAVVLLAIGDAMRVPKRAVAATKSPAEIRQGHIGGALDACRLWTDTHAKLPVNEVLSESEIPGKGPADHFRVGLEWHAKGTGLLMFSDCEYQLVGEKLVLVKARSSESVERVRSAAR